MITASTVSQVTAPASEGIHVLCSDGSAGLPVFASFCSTTEPAALLRGVLRHAVL